MRDFLVSGTPNCGTSTELVDRALTLANVSAKAINQLGMGDKYIGMYAYNQHSPPPTIKVHPKVIISATTAFLRGGYTLEQIIDGWKKQGATIGVYDYFSVIAGVGVGFSELVVDAPQLSKREPLVSQFVQHNCLDQVQEADRMPLVHRVVVRLENRVGSGVILTRLRDEP